VSFVVESASDAACEAICRVMDEHPERDSRLLVAGLASGGGQKIHNLRAATAAMSPRIKYLAFVDSDAQPRPQWLRSLLARLDRPGIGATTGYRWFVPARATLANWSVYSINCLTMALLGRQSYYLVWGGSWAISRGLFDSLGIRKAWKGALSDDLVVSRLLRKAALRTRFEPVAVVASPIDHGWRPMFSFIRRQYLFGRFHVPHWWVMGLVATTLGNIAWLGGLAIMGCSLVLGTPSPWIPLAVCTALYVVGACRGAMRQTLVRTYFPDQERALRAARHFDIWAGPLVGVINWLAILGSAFGRHIRWRGIEYRLLPGGQVSMVRRQIGPTGPAVLQEADRYRPRDRDQVLGNTGSRAGGTKPQEVAARCFRNVLE
jgi:hypothetical protein